MKRRNKVFLLTFCALCVGMIVSLALPQSAVFADNGSDLNDNINGILDSLDLTLLQQYLNENQDSFLFHYGSTAQEIIAYLVNGNYDIRYSSYIGEILSVLFGNVVTLVPAFAQMTAVALICAITSSAEGSILSKTTAKTVKLACYALIVVIVMSMLAGIVSSTVECVNNIKTQVEIITPILITLTVLTGGGNSGAVFQPSALFLSGGAVEIITEFVFPATIAVIIFDVMSKLNGEVNFSGTAKLIKSILKWVIGITVTVFSIFITVQSTATSIFDGIFFKATKYLVGSSVPIVGNFLSAGVDMVVSAGSVIKSSVGLFGILLLIGEIIQPVVLLAAFSLILKVVGAVVQPMGENTLYSLFSDLSTDVDYFIAGLLTVSFMYFLVMMLSVSSVTNLI